MHKSLIYLLPNEMFPTCIAASKAGGVAVTDSAATSLNSALATRTFDSECDDCATKRQLGVVMNPDTAPIEASSNTRALLSRFIVYNILTEFFMIGVDGRTTYVRRTLAHPPLGTLTQTRVVV